MKVAFLVYDSRSGSTLLSRELSARFGDLFVTPEIGFDALLRMDGDMLKKQGWPSVLRHMFDGHEFINLKLSYEKVLSLVEPPAGPLSAADGIMAILREYARENGRADCQWIIVKNGSHLQYWKKIKRLFNNDIPLLHIVRDPRAVVNSKLHTARPYYPGEVMAWGGVVLAALRWKLYVSKINGAKSQGMSVCEIRYEYLTSDIVAEMARISGFLQLAHEIPGVIYRVPEREKAIHKLVINGGIEQKRTEAWVNELTRWDALKVEAVCGKEMKELGYPVRGGMVRGLFRTMACLMDMPAMAIKILIHYWRMYKRGPLTADRSSDN